MNNDIVGLGFCGAFSVLTFFVTLIYIKNREKIYANYALFLVFMLIYSFINIRVDHWEGIFIYDYFKTNKRFVEPITIFSFSAYIYFSIDLIEIKTQSKAIYKFFKWWAFSCILYSISYFLFYSYISPLKMEIFITARIIIFSCSAYFLIKIIKTINSPVKFEYISGTVAYFIGSILATIRFSFPEILFPFLLTFSAYIYFITGVLIETIFFALALGHRIYFLSNEKQLHNEVLLEKLVKNDLIIQAINRKLESKISESEAEIIRKQEKLNEQEKKLVEAEYERKLNQSEILARRMQMNPHFIFNCLNSIKYLIQTDQKDKATTYLIIFSKFIRKVLETSEMNSISLQSELEIIENYLQLEKNRFNDDFSYQIIKITSDKIAHVTIPPLLLQPFVENAIWHGLMNSSKTTKKIRINTEKLHDHTLIAISDNGVGMEIAGKINKNILKKSMGLSITKSRIKLFEYHSNQKILFSIDDVIEAGEIQGTLVNIRIFNTINQGEQQS